MTHTKNKVLTLEERFPGLGIEHSNWDLADNPSLTFCHVDAVFPTVILEKSPKPLAFSYAEQTLDITALKFMDVTCGREVDAQTFLDRRLQNDALLVMHKGKVVHESYRNGMSESDVHINMSTTKSYTGMLAAQAVCDGKLDADAPVGKYVPELAKSWTGITVQHVMDMCSGIKYEEHYDNPNSEVNQHGRSSGWLPADGCELKGSIPWVIAEQHERQAEPGEYFNYNSSHTELLAYITEQATGEKFCDLLEKLLQHCGTEADCEMGIDRAGFPIAEGAMSMTLRDFARSATMMLSKGLNLAGERVLDAQIFNDTLTDRTDARVRFAKGEYGAAFPEGQYRNQFWVMDASAEIYFMLGVHGQFAYADLKRDLLIVGYGSYSNAANGAILSHVLTLWTTLSAEFELSDL